MNKHSTRSWYQLPSESEHNTQTQTFTVITNAKIREKSDNGTDVIHHLRHIYNTIVVQWDPQHLTPLYVMGIASQNQFMRYIWEM